MKNNRLFILPIVIGVLLTSCGDNYTDPKEVTFSVSTLENVDIHTTIQNDLIASENPDSFIYDYAYPTSQKAVESNSFPESFKVTYEIDSGSISPRQVSVLVSEKEDMSNPMVLIGNNTEASITNLKIHQTYYYQVEAKYLSSFVSEVKSFTVTTNKIRNVFVEGVENCRDLGGWDIGENRIYKQGLIYRTAQFNYGGKDNDYVSAPSKNGIKTLKQDLKIKTEIDLRETKSFSSIDEVNGITSSPLGKDVKYVSAPMLFRNSNIFTKTENKDSLKLFFETLADESNYPIAFHCLRGTDRTGGLAYAIGALVGMSRDDLMLDYLFSNMGAIGSVVRKYSIDAKYVSGIENSSGETYSEKAKNYLMANIDVSEETLDKIIDILTD